MCSAHHIKICGLSDHAALEAAVAAGASHIGLVFFPKSPRHVGFTLAADLAAAARGRVAVVALTVNADDSVLDRIAKDVAPDVIQLHGQEAPERILEVKSRLAVEVWKAWGLAAPGDMDAASEYRAAADRMLYDAKPTAPSDGGLGLPGGNGVTFDWRLLDAAPRGERYLLSGGLTPQNVASAIALTGAPGIDVSSGVERAPGQKDPELIRAFIRAARAAWADGPNVETASPVPLAAEAAGVTPAIARGPGDHAATIQRRAK